MARHSTVIILLLALSTFSSSKLLTSTLDSEWFFRDLNSTEFHKAKVPGCVHLDLMENKIIPDPYYRDNSNNLTWIETKDWQYKTTFSVSEEFLNQPQVDIVFEVLDTHAEIELNGEQIILANNAFRTWRKDVKKQLKAAGNELVVTFRSAWNYDNKKKEEMLPLVRKWA
jgi:beta-mannosidase